MMETQTPISSIVRNETNRRYLAALVSCLVKDNKQVLSSAEFANSYGFTYEGVFRIFETLERRDYLEDQGGRPQKWKAAKKLLERDFDTLWDDITDYGKTAVTEARFLSRERSLPLLTQTNSDDLTKNGNQQAPIKINESALAVSPNGYGVQTARIKKSALRFVTALVEQMKIDGATGFTMQQLERRIGDPVVAHDVIRQYRDLAEKGEYLLIDKSTRPFLWRSSINSLGDDPRKAAQLLSAVKVNSVPRKSSTDAVYSVPGLDQIMANLNSLMEWIEAIKLHRDRLGAFLKQVDGGNSISEAGSFLGIGEIVEAEKLYKVARGKAKSRYDQVCLLLERVPDFRNFQVLLASLRSAAD